MQRNWFAQKPTYSCIIYTSKTRIYTCTPNKLRTCYTIIQQKRLTRMRERDVSYTQTYRATVYGSQSCTPQLICVFTPRLLPLNIWQELTNLTFSWRVFNSVSSKHQSSRTSKLAIFLRGNSLGRYLIRVWRVARNAWRKLDVNVPVTHRSEHVWRDFI